jgi:hypothetical protein
VIDFLHGSIGAATLLADASKAQGARDLSQVCEAHFYMAEDAVLRQRPEAVELFRLAVKECPPNFHEYEGATAELRAMGVPLALPGPATAATQAAPAASVASAVRRTHVNSRPACDSRKPDSRLSACRVAFGSTRWPLAARPPTRSGRKRGHHRTPKNRAFGANVTSRRAGTEHPRTATA